MIFDGAKHFGRLALVAIVGTLIAVPDTGPAPIFSIGIALWYLLKLCNALERRDRQNHFRNPPGRNR